MLVKSPSAVSVPHNSLDTSQVFPAGQAASASCASQNVAPLVVLCGHTALCGTRVNNI